MVDREPRHDGIASLQRLILEQRGETHQCVSSPLRSSGRSSETSTSRLSSGKTPSIGPARVTTLRTTGAAVQPAERWPELEALPRGPSSSTSTTKRGWRAEERRGGKER